MSYLTHVFNVNITKLELYEKNFIFVVLSVTTHNLNIKPFVSYSRLHIHRLIPVEMYDSNVVQRLLARNIPKNVFNQKG